MDVDREHKPAHLLEMARNHNSLSAEINAMDPIDRRIHLQRMADLAKQQENDPNLAKVKITLDTKGDPLDITVENNSAWQRFRYNGKTSDVYDTPKELASKEPKSEPKRELTPQEARERATTAASYLAALEIPGISDAARILNQNSRK
ncbi:MAG: hypothetical protein IPL73_03020 [Candidatus Obscuribacter sp.]|nr:hypothetical protein [Candidatus Obscuribacter sp.]